MCPFSDLLVNPCRQPDGGILQTIARGLRSRAHELRIARIALVEGDKLSDRGLFFRIRLSFDRRRENSWEVQMDSHKPIGMLFRQPRRHTGAPVAALCDPTCISEPLHQFGPGFGYPRQAPARLRRLVRKAVTRQRRHNDMESVLDLAAVGCRVDQGSDDLEEFKDRTWPAVRQYDRQCPFVF